MSLQRVFNKLALRKVFATGISIAVLSGCATIDQFEDQGYDTENNTTTVTENLTIHEKFTRDIIRPWKIEIDKNPSNRGKGHFHYRLNTDVPFDDYAHDQQFAMLTDYADRFLHPDHKSTYMSKTYGENDCDATNDLSTIIEETYPQAEQMRLNMPDRRQESLTNNEIVFVKNFFGDQIDASIIRKHFEAISCKSVVATTSNKEQLSFYGKKHHSDDYSLEESSYNFGTFIHEITHIWQNQNDEKYTNGSAEDVEGLSDYKYTLSKKRPFTDYDDEQQGAIIEDYARYFLHSEKETWILDATEENLKVLKNMVETQFPSAKGMREFYEKHGKLPTEQIIVKVTNSTRPSA